MNEEEKKVIEENFNSILLNAKANWLYEDYEILLKFQDLYKKQQQEIEEKTTIIMAGAEKVKQLDKQIHNLNIEKIEQQKEIEDLKWKYSKF